MRIARAAMFLAITCAPAFAAPQVELEVVNRFRLLKGEQQQSNYYADLEQRLFCGTFKNRNTAAFSKRCGRDKLFNLDRMRPNYLTNWTKRDFAFSPDFVHDMSRTVRVKLVGLANAKQAQCQWTVNGATLATQSCEQAEHPVTLGADRSAGVDVSVVARNKAGQQIPVPPRNIPIRDVVIATVGDSFLSGEGNPHLAYRRPLGGADSPFFGKRSEWLDIRCHRSLFTGAVIAVERLARRVRTQSVTMLPLACSGAETKEGILGPYLGRETNTQAIEDQGQNFTPLPIDDIFQTRVLPTQFQLLARTLCPGNIAGGACNQQAVQPDLVILSTGGNEIGFADIVRELAAGKEKPPLSLAQKLDKLPALYKEINDAIDAIKPRKVFALSYPDPTQQFRKINGRDKLVYCDDVKATLEDGTFVPRFATLLGFGITAKGAKAAQQEVIKPLNKHLSDAATRFKWQLMTLPDDVQQGHGFCSKTAAWFYGFGESLQFQGLIGSDKNELHGDIDIGNVPSGAMHPNIFGHFNMAEKIYSELRKAVGP
jgi:hypothetical protein